MQKAFFNFNSWNQKMIRKYDTNTIRNLQFFSKITSINPIECFPAENYLVFVIPKGSAPKAIGKQGKNIKQIKSSLKKEVKVIEESNSLEELIQNFLFPLKVNKIEIKENTSKIVEITFKNRNDRRILLKNQQELLKCLKAVVAHFYKEVKDIRVL